MNILTVGAHFDDIELGCGGSVAKHLKEGDEVYMLVVTDSGYEDYNGVMLRSKEVALKEGEKAASILGVKRDNLICLEYETKKVKHLVRLIEQINRIIDKQQIDIIYTHWIHDTYQDHSAVGRATLSAARRIPRVLMYKSNWYLSSIPFNANFFVDISSYIEIKIRAIKMHKTEYKKYGQKWIDFIKSRERSNGIKVGVEYAEAFEIVKYLR